MRIEVRKDIGLKLISILFAFLLWVIVINTSNPLQTENITVQLKVVNEDTLASKGLSIKNKNYTRNVVITVKGRKEALSNIDENDFEAVLDFSKVTDEDTKQIPINRPVYTGKEIVTVADVSPKLITVDLEKDSIKSFNVGIITTGSPKQNYRIVSKTAIPDSFTMDYPESVIKDISSIRAAIDVTGLDRDTTVQKDCKVYNQKGEEIPTLSKSLKVGIKLQVAKEVPVFISTKGNLPPDYIETSRSISPAKALITGPPDVLSKISELVTDPIALTTANGSISTTAQIKLPEGAKLYNTPGEAMVNITVERILEKTVTVSADTVSLINMSPDNSLNYQIQTQNIAVKVKGRKADLDNFDLSLGKPTLDVAGLGEGDYKLPLNITLPPAITLSGSYEMEVKISKAK